MPLPDLDQTIPIEDLSLCDSDVDWFYMDLSAGDHITISGTADINAQMRAYNTDGATIIDEATFFSSLDFDAYVDGRYLL